MLLLRIVVGLSTAAAGFFYLRGWHDSSSAIWLAGVLLILSGIGMLIGLLTPIASFLSGIYFLGVLASWIALPALNLHEVRPISCGLAATAFALMLLGPGAFSLDSYFWGRREIVISPSTETKES